MFLEHSANDTLDLFAHLFFSLGNVVRFYCEIIFDFLAFLIRVRRLFGSRDVISACALSPARIEIMLFFFIVLLLLP